MKAMMKKKNKNKNIKFPVFNKKNRFSMTVSPLSIYQFLKTSPIFLEKIAHMCVVKLPRKKRLAWSNV